MKRKPSASRTPRALDPVRARRQGGTEASGNVAGRGLRTLPGGQHELFLGDLLYFGPKGEIEFRDPAPPLLVAPGSPRRMTLAIDTDHEVSPAGKLRLRKGDSIRLENGLLEARPTSADVSDENEDTVADGLQRLGAAQATAEGDIAVLDADVAALELRVAALEAVNPLVPIAVGAATLVGGTVDVVLAEIAAGARVMLTYEALGGTPGFLTYTVDDGVGFTIDSSSALDTGTVAYAVWNP